MRGQRIATLAIPLLLYGGAAFAASSGTPLDTVATQIMTIVTGPIALLSDHRWFRRSWDNLLPWKKF